MSRTIAVVLPVAPMYAGQDRPNVFTDLLIWILAVGIVPNPFRLEALEDQ